MIPNHEKQMDTTKKKEIKTERMIGGYKSGTPNTKKMMKFFAAICDGKL